MGGNDAGSACLLANADGAPNTKPNDNFTGLFGRHGVTVRAAGNSVKDTKRIRFWTMLLKAS